MTKEQSLIYPSLTQAVFLLVLFLLSTLVIAVIQEVLLDGNVTPLLKLCRKLGAMSIVILYLISKRSVTNLTFPFKKTDAKICLWMFPIGVLFFVFMLGALLILLLIFMFFLEPDLKADTSVYSVHIYTFISIVCITPIFEEWLFRGIILNSFLQRYSLAKAILLSAILFAILHGGLQILTAVFLGILTGYIYYVTKSIWPGILLHGTNNFCAFIGLNLVNHNISSDLLQSVEKYFFVIVILWVVIMIVFLLILCHFLSLLKSKYNFGIQ